MNPKKISFDYFYIFVMVIYMASITKATSTLFSISGDISIIAILIPNLLTLVLINKNISRLKPDGNRWLGVIGVLVLIWIGIIAMKFGTVEARSGLYTVYYIALAYVQVRIFGKSLFLYYEDIMVKMAKLTLIMWAIGVLVPPIAHIYTMFPISNEGGNRTMDGYNVLYLFCWNNDPTALIPRNAGFAWEPGRYAIMLALAILVNIYRKGIRFSHNSNVIWLLVSMASTMSTTGFSLLIVLYIYFAIKKINLKYILYSLIIFIPIVYGILQLDFMGEKFNSQLESVENSNKLIERLNWHEDNMDDYRLSVDRFLSLFFEWENIKHDPITGYGPTAHKSYFETNIASNATLTGGLLKMFGKYGIPLGLFFYFILYRSSKGMAEAFYSKKKYGLLLCFLLSAISYSLFCVPLYTTFWFYGVFAKKSNKPVKIKQIYYKHSN